MATTLRTVARSQLRTQRLRFALTKLGIALAAFFLCSIFLMNASVSVAARQAVAQVYSASDAVLQPADNLGSPYMGPTLPPATVEAVSQNPAVKDVWGLTGVTEFLVTNRQGSLSNGYAATRFDMPTASTMFPYPLSEGNLPVDDGQVLISSIDAEKYNLAVGATVELSDYRAVTTDMITANEEFPTSNYTVSGIFDVTASNDVFANAIFTHGNLTAGYASLVTQAWGSEAAGTVYTLLLTFHNEETGMGQLQASLPQDSAAAYQLLTAEEQIEKDVELSSIAANLLTYVLLAFATLALLMAGFIIGNTMQVLSHQRSQELALLRVLGAKRGALTRMLLGEATLLGLGAALAGVIATYGFALFSQYFADGFVVSFSPIPGLLAIGICTAITAACSLVPALRVYRTSPLQALISQPADQRLASRGIVFTLLLICCTAGGLLSLLGIVQGRTVVIYTATFMLATICVLLVPLAIRPFLTLFARWSKPYSTAQFANKNALRSRPQTAAASRMLFTCAALLAAVLTGYTSVKATVLATIEDGSPYQISAVARVANYGDALALEQELLDLSQVRGATVGLVQATLQTEENPTVSVPIYTVDPDQFTALGPQINPLHLGDNELLISPTWAQEAKINSGDAVTVRGTRGEKQLTAVISEQNLHYSFITRATGKELSGQDRYPYDYYESDRALIFVSLFEGVAASDQQETTLQIANTANISPDSLTGAVTDIAEAERTMNLALSLIFGLLGIALLISLVGIANTQVLSAYQRHHENALLRSLGLSRVALRKVIGLETLSVAALSIALGIIAGTLLAMLLLQTLISEGIALHYAFHWQGLLITWLAGIALAWLSGVIPAYRASRVPPVAALRQIT